MTWKCKISSDKGNLPLKHPLLFGPKDGRLLSGQQPYFVFSQIMEVNGRLSKINQSLVVVVGPCEGNMEQN